MTVIPINRAHPGGDHTLPALPDTRHLAHLTDQALLRAYNQPGQRNCASADTDTYFPERTDPAPTGHSTPTGRPPPAPCAPAAPCRPCCLEIAIRTPVRAGTPFGEYGVLGGALQDERARIRVARQTATAAGMPAPVNNNIVSEQIEQVA